MKYLHFHRHILTSWPVKSALRIISNFTNMQLSPWHTYEKLVQVNSCKKLEMKFSSTRNESDPYHRHYDITACIRVTCKTDIFKQVASCAWNAQENLYVCHTDLQQNISCASFAHQIERVLFRASFSCEFLVRVSHSLLWGLQKHTPHSDRQYDTPQT